MCDEPKEVMVLGVKAGTHAAAIAVVADVLRSQAEVYDLEGQGCKASTG